MKTFLLVVFCLFLLTLGSSCLFFPKSLQIFASRAVGMGITSKISVLKAYIESDSYLVSLRIIGLVAYAMCTVLAVGAYKGSAH